MLSQKTMDAIELKVRQAYPHSPADWVVMAEIVAQAAVKAVLESEEVRGLVDNAWHISMAGDTATGLDFNKLSDALAPFREVV